MVLRPLVVGEASLVIDSDAEGNLVYAASRSAVPADLAGALIDAGCVTAMELDINPYQNRPASQFLTGWTRDFSTVQAAG